MIRQLKFDEFLRSVAISKDNSYAMLFGAGCSISSDIQSADDCIWEWKKIIYKSNNPNAQDWIENYKDSKVQDIIQKWIDNQGTYIQKGSVEEYSFYAQKCFPIDENRRQYFQKICSNKEPSVGYRVIPILLKQGMLDSIWTTNFDDLINVACINAKVQAIDISLGTVERINQRTQNKNELPIIKLHGDYKYGPLKNSSQELQSQDETLRNKFIDYLSDKNLIVIGYSGRDSSLMDTLKKAYTKPGAGILYWCGYGDDINTDVSKLLQHIEEHGRQAFYISTDGFDNTMLNISKLIVEDDLKLKEELKQVKNLLQSDNLQPFNLQLQQTNKVLKSNLFPIEFPKEVFVFDAKINVKPWKVIKDRTLDDLNISAVPYRKNIWAFGTAEYVQQKFADLINGELKRKPLTEIKIHNESMKSLLLSALCKLFSISSSVKTNFKDKLWDDSKFKIISSQKVYEAITIGLEKIKGEYYLSFNPDFYLANNNISKEIKQRIGLSFFHRIWNQDFNNYINNWRKKLLNGKNDTICLDFPTNMGTGFTFKIDKNPIFTNVCDLNSPYSNTPDNVHASLIKLKGVQFKEIGLLFSTRNGSNKISDTHPMRGLVKNRPYELGLNNIIGSSINLGVICPVEDSEKLYNFLNMQNQEIQKNNPKDDYIIDFNGFYNIYGLSLNIPTTSSQNWSNLNNPTSNNFKEIVHEIKTNICDKINNQCSIGSQKILIIYIPSRWEKFLHYNDGIESFDLHDYIKAFCAEKGVTSQIIKEKTILDKSQSCQINWWLSLSYFVKSFRTPWVIDNADKSTAFAGIGYSIDNKKDHEGHIVLGCSHIYSSNGEGLKYKLSKVNDKIKWINKKPHLSYDDAYEFGKNVLNLFYESMNELPKRVVIHKRTFYTAEEKKGILDSLYDSKKIENVDLIEINFEDNIRYVSSKINNRKAEIDIFSVSRGTCIQLNKNEALLYTHGSVPSVVNQNRNFYPGGRYIPKPLRIIKHHGLGSLEQIANEILGLTKMNWNSLNMYSQLPATISSSNEIARIGKLIENTEKIQYDYRYFI
ncbi:SIR2 family protein [Riemerella anatipestifer]|uniref:SIR2 family protein n=1 Tax=Riemerella anatipestifer TaxID=34085 RepID=UPI0030C07268